MASMFGAKIIIELNENDLARAYEQQLQTNDDIIAFAIYIISRIGRICFEMGYDVHYIKM